MADPSKYPTSAAIKSARTFLSHPVTRPDVFGDAGQRALEKERAGLASFLGATDYGQQLEQSQDMGKLQLALALAQRGFAAAGATPKRGESSISTLSRELLSPVAGDAGAVASRMMQQRQALKAAERQEERQLKLAALQNVQRRQEQEYQEKVALETAARQQVLAQRNVSEAVSNEYLVNGENVPIIVQKNHFGEVTGFLDLDRRTIPNANVKILPKPVAGAPTNSLKENARVFLDVVQEGDDGNVYSIPGTAMANVNVRRSADGLSSVITTVGDTRTEAGDFVPSGTVVKSYDTRKPEVSVVHDLVGQTYLPEKGYVYLPSVTRVQTITHQGYGQPPVVQLTHYARVLVDKEFKSVPLQNFSVDQKTHGKFVSENPLHVVDSNAFAAKLGLSPSSVRPGDTLEIYRRASLVKGKNDILEYRFKGTPVRLDQKFVNSKALQTTALTDKQKAELGVAVEKIDDTALQAGSYRLFTTEDGTLKPYKVNGRVPLFKIISKGKDAGRLVEVGGGDDKLSFTRDKLEQLKLTALPYKAPSEPPAATGMKSNQFKDAYEGFLNSFASIQADLGGESKGIRFSAERHSKGQNPWIHRDGKPLSEEDNKRISRMIQSQYYNQTRGGVYKGATQDIDVNRMLVESILNTGLEAWALTRKTPEKPAAVPPAAVPPAAPPPVPQKVTPQKVTPPVPQRARIIPQYLTSKAAQLARYGEAAEGFKTDPIAANTLNWQPAPITGLISNGIGRLVLFRNVNVKFDESTTSPPQDQNNRAEAVSSLSSNYGTEIQDRIDAEKLSKGTGLSVLLNAKATTPDKKSTAVLEALAKVRETRFAIQQRPANLSASGDLNSALDAYKALSKIRVLAARSRVQGVVRGPLEVAGRKLFGLELGEFLRTPEAQQAANEFIATLPVLEELASRQALKAAGEGSRMSDKDLQGMKRVFPKAGENFEYSIDKINAFLRHLRSGIDTMLQQVGNFTPSDTSLEKAASLGFDLKAIDGQQNYYSPYLKDQNYAITKQPVPSYSKRHQEQLRNKAVLDHVAVGVPGQAKAYELMVLGSDGQPIWDENNKKYLTTVVPGSALNTKENQKMIQFNTDWLKKEYRLDR